MLYLYTLHYATCLDIIYVYALLTTLCVTRIYSHLSCSKHHFVNDDPVPVSSSAKAQTQAASCQVLAPN